MQLLLASLLPRPLLEGIPIGCALLIGAKLNTLAQQAGQTVHQLKRDLLDDDLDQQLKNSLLRITFA